MQTRTKNFLNVTLVFLVIAWVGGLHAGERGTNHGMASAAPSGPPGAYVEPFGMALVPPVYFVNFLLLYFSNPESATYMPAYKVPLPQEVYECLVDHPEGCPYADMAQYFAAQALDRGGSRNKNAFWSSACQTDPRWANLAPREYRHPDEINEPLGREKADQLARLMGIDQEMILTDEQYQCLIGTSPRHLVREIIYACSIDLTNSNGNASTPLSSYGLSLGEHGEVRSVCAPHAPCLAFNKLFFGPFEAIAKDCGFADKLARLVSETPILEFIDQGGECQHEWLPTCIAEAACPGNGGQSNNSCAASIATQ
jgi:hypothetical protein